MPGSQSVIQNGDARNTPVYLTSEEFLRNTKAKSVKIASAQSYVDGGRSTFRLPQAGLGHKIWVGIQGSIVLGGTWTTAGLFKGYPFPTPWNLIKRIKFGSNNAFNMRDMSGQALYLWLRERYGIDPIGADTWSNQSANNKIGLGLTDTAEIVGGAAPAAGTYKFNMVFPLDLSYNEAGEQGLIVLQQNSTFYDLVIDWGSWAQAATSAQINNDLVVATTGTDVTITPTITVSVGLDYFDVLPGIGKLVSMFMSVNDYQQTLVNGTNVIKPPVNDFYTMITLQATNGSTIVPVPIANISNPLMMHSGNIYDYQDDYIIRLGKTYYKHRNVSPDGTITWDMGLRRGLIGKRDTLDAFDDMNVTDFTLKFDCSATMAGTSTILAVYESLRYIKQI